MKKFFRALSLKLRQPKWRHGKLSALMMACFLIACVLINVAVQSLEDEYGWRKDYSFNQYATTGEETQQVLDRVSQDIELYLLYQNDSEDTRILQVLDRYAVLCDRISVLPTDIAKNPGILTRFHGDLDSALESDSVVVNCPATGRYRVLSASDFFTQGYNIEAETFEYIGLAYEKRLTEAIAYVTQEVVPVVGVLQGHGELTLSELRNLLDFLKSNNYDSVPVHLQNGDSLSDVDLLLIAGPQKDLSNDEVTAISAFAQGGGSMLCTRNYTDPISGMPNYFSLLKSYGIVPLPGVVVSSEEDVGSYYGERIYLVPYMNQLDMTAPLISGGMDLLLLAGACAFENPPEPDQSLSVATVLKSGTSAYIRNPNDGLDTIEQQPGDRQGELSLALYAHRMHANGNISRMFAIGNSSLFTDAYVYQRTYNQPFILQLMGQLLPQKSILLNIMTPAAFRPALTVGSQTTGIVMLIALPLLIIIAALCVLLPRKNR
ncbi:MAG: Gldg family protein [Clostridia bacterium]